MTTSPLSPDELVLKVAREIERVFYEAVDRGDMRGPQAFEHAARAAIAAMPELTELQQRVKQLEDALEPFANCIEQIADNEDDEEWAKFRLLIKNYRSAAKALWPNRKGFIRCPTCKGEFDQGEWNAATECPECETPKARPLLSDKGEEK